MQVVAQVRADKWDREYGTLNNTDYGGGPHKMIHRHLPDLMFEWTDKIDDGMSAVCLSQLLFALNYCSP
jgi:hypothetical protein